MSRVIIVMVGESAGQLCGPDPDFVASLEEELDTLGVEYEEVQSLAEVRSKMGGKLAVLFLTAGLLEEAEILCQESPNLRVVVFSAYATRIPKNVRLADKGVFDLRALLGLGAPSAL